MQGGKVRSSPGRRAAVCQMQNHLLPVSHHLSLQPWSACLSLSHQRPLLLPRLQLHTEVSPLEVKSRNTHTSDRCVEVIIICLHSDFITECSGPPDADIATHNHCVLPQIPASCLLFAVTDTHWMSCSP